MADVSIDDLATAIADAVQDYTDDVSDAIEKRVDEAAKEIRDDIARTAPKRKGKYAKGFRVSKSDRRGVTRRIIWNKTDHRIAHLQEFGHAKVGGGRVSAKPHIRPAYDRHAAKLAEDIKRIIREGG